MFVVAADYRVHRTYRLTDEACSESRAPFYSCQCNSITSWHLHMLTSQMGGPSVNKILSMCAPI